MLPAKALIPPSTFRSPHLFQSPDRALWLDDLRMECFDEVMAMPEHQVCEALAEIGRALPGREDFEDLFGIRVASPQLLRHILLVARFLEQKKTAALEIVAREQLDEELLEGWRTDGGRLHRLPVALMLYAQSPENLLALLLWDRWHTRRRVSWRLDGRHRRLPDLEPETWREVADRILGELSDDPAFQGLSARAVLQRRESGELLLAFREPAHREVLKTDDGALVSGRHNGWMLLALYHDGARLDVTDVSEERGAVLASRMISAVRGGDCRYLPVRDPLDEDRMSTFLSALCDPADHRFPLLEITALLPGRHEPRWVTLGGQAQGRAERDLAGLRQIMPLAMDWRDVRSVKVGFEGKYRFTLELGEDAGKAAVWYSDRERDKDVSRRFEDHLRRTLGMNVVPRPGARGRRQAAEEKAPPKGSVGWWQALLAPVVDTPAPWMRAAWAELEVERLVTLCRSSAMGCGTPYVDARVCGVDEHDCAGEIELGWGDVDTEDPMLQLPGAKAICPVCDRAWRPGRYRLPLIERVRIDVDLDALGLRIFRAVASVARAEPFDGEPGVFEARTTTGRYYVVFAPMLRVPTSFAPGQGLPGRTAWVKLDGEDGPGIPVSRLLADPTVLGTAWGMPAQGEQVQVREPGPRDVPRVAQAAPAEEPTRNRLSLRGRTVYLDNVPVLAPQAKAQRALLAVFIHLAQEDARKGKGERRGHSFQRVLSEAALVGLRLDEVEARKQVSRMNMAARTARVRAGWAPLELVEKVKGGYRVVEGIEAGEAGDLMVWLG